MTKAFTRPFEPSEQAVRSLIRRASRHPHGRNFLLTGALDAVAATFAVHAFTVEKARELLAEPARGRAAAAPARPRNEAKGA